MPYLRMRDLELGNQRLLIREDLNVPVADGQVTSDKRIVAALPTIQMALEGGARVMLMSHLGRPTEGQYDPAVSLGPVARCLSQLLEREVPLVQDWLQGVDVAPGQVVLCENVRFNIGEGDNAEDLSRRLAALCDIFVMDAFGTAHRAQASTHGVAKYAPVACAGPLLDAELTALAQVTEAPARPMLAIVGGSKVSTKLTVLDALSSQVDQLIVGGGIANTFIAAAGHEVGCSLYEPDLLDEARRLMQAAHVAGNDIPVPVDVVVAREFSRDAEATLKPVGEVAADEMILDIGPETAQHYADMIAKAGTVVWNGPVGVFEFNQFGAGTRSLADAIATSSAFSIAGGGDTLAAIDQYGIGDSISYISTGGGAFLEFLEGRELPAVAILKLRGSAS